MAKGNERNIINPVLRFLREPTPKSITGGGKNEKSIAVERLNKQREYLSRSIDTMEKEKFASRAGKSHLVVRMFGDSNAPSYTPSDLFNESVGCKIIVPAYDGYMVEAEISALEKVASKIRTSTSIKDKVDISRVESIAPFSNVDVLRGREASSFWSDDDVSEHHFNLWLMPFNSIEARKLIAEDILNFYNFKDISFGDEKYDTDFVKGYSLGAGIKDSLSEYIQHGKASVSVKVKSKNAFDKIVSSGAVYRIPESVKPAPTLSLSPPASTF